MLLVTDGLSRDGRRTEDAAWLLRQAHVIVYTVSLDSGDVDAEELYKIATSVDHRCVGPVQVGGNHLCRQVTGLCCCILEL